MRVARTRGAVGGAAIALLGVWGALIPFIGPSFNYVIGPDQSWHWTAGRFWLSLLPGLVAIVGGLLLMTSARRPTASLGALMGVAAGAWFIVGPTVSELWHHGVSQAGTIHGGSTLRVFEQLGYFSALGALILYFAAAALGRLSVRSVRDVELAEADAAPVRATPVAAAPAAAPVAEERVPAGAPVEGERATAAASAAPARPRSRRRFGFSRSR